MEQRGVASIANSSVDRSLFREYYCGKCSSVTCGLLATARRPILFVLLISEAEFIQRSVEFVCKLVGIRAVSVRVSPEAGYPELGSRYRRLKLEVT